MPYVYPPRNKEAETARLLLSLADEVRDVATNTEEGLAFVVPDYLYQKYLAAITPSVSEPVPDPELERRRPGRPRKTVPAKESDD